VDKGKLGISTSSAADSFNKKQWELMEAMKVDYQKQTDKKMEAATLLVLCNITLKAHV